MKKILSDRKFIVPAALVVILMMIFVVTQLVMSIRAVNATLREMAIEKEASVTRGWNVPEIRSVKTDILWFEQLLVLAKHDSISLVVNLNDSVVQISLKGLDLLQTKILRQYPSNFLTSAGEATRMHYGRISPIINESAGIPKRQVKKVVAFASAGNNHEPSENQINDKPLHWKFTTAGNMGMVITGVQMSADSTYILQTERDLLKYRALEIMRDPFPSGYTPTLHLWLDDRDAKAIYKAVSSKGNVLFRN
jgi:hypothetical protein